MSNRCFFNTAEVVADNGETKEIVDVVADDGEAMENVDVVVDDGEATEIVGIVANNDFFLLNISATLWECLAARFKSFLLIVYTYDALQ